MGNPKLIRKYFKARIGRLDLVRSITFDVKVALPD